MKAFKNSKRTIQEIAHNEDYNIIYKDAVSRFDSSDDIITKSECIAIMIGLDTGLRVSDLLRLTWGSIVYDKEVSGYVCISHIKKTNIKNHKTRINTSTYNYIQEFKALTPANEDSIFFNYNNGSLFTRIWLSKRTTLRYGFTFHELRKISAKRMLESGTIATASKHLGHKRVSTTDAYLNVSETSHLEQVKSLYN